MTQRTIRKRMLEWLWLDDAGRKWWVPVYIDAHDDWWHAHVYCDGKLVATREEPNRGTLLIWLKRIRHDKVVSDKLAPAVQST